MQFLQSDKGREPRTGFAYGLSNVTVIREKVDVIHRVMTTGMNELEERRWVLYGG